MFVFAFAFVCSVEVVLGQTNRQSHGWITSADGQWHRCEITSMGTMDTQILRITRTRYIPQRGRGDGVLQIVRAIELIWSPCGNTYIHISEAVKPWDK